MVEFVLTMSTVTPANAEEVIQALTAVRKVYIDNIHNIIIMLMMYLIYT